MVLAEVLEPVLVHGNDVLSFHTYLGAPHMNIMTFTASGELLLVSHAITD